MQRDATITIWRIRIGMRRNPPNRGIERTDTINGKYLNESLHGGWMSFDMNPLEVDVGRKKNKADARYSLTSACLGHCLFFKMIRATAPPSKSLLLLYEFILCPAFICLSFSHYKTREIRAVRKVWIVFRLKAEACVWNKCHSFFALFLSV